LGDSVLGHRCIIGHGAEFDGVAFNTVYLYRYCEIFAAAKFSARVKHPSQ
jgi:hypothetical protein